MKKLITLSLMAAAFSAAARQQKGGAPVRDARAQPLNANVVAQRGTSTTTINILPASFNAASPCFSDIDVYATNDGDYLAGNNSFGDKEFLQSYTMYPGLGVGLPATVDTVRVLLGFKKQAGNGPIRAKVYADNGSGAPGALLATSADKTVSQVDVTTGKTMDFGFPTPVALTTSKFYVAVDVSSLYATGDTVALFTTNMGCASAEPMGSYTKVSDNSFVAYSAPTASGGWGGAYDLSIFAKATVTKLGIGQTRKDDFGARAYPVPAGSQVTISFTGQDNGQTTLQLKDLTGRTIATSSLHTSRGGSYSVPFTVDGLSTGMYFVELASGANRGMIKVSVR